MADWKKIAEEREKEIHDLIKKCNRSTLLRNIAVKALKDAKETIHNESDLVEATWNNMWAISCEKIISNALISIEAIKSEDGG